MLFVSYSRTDIGETSDFARALSRHGVECWIDESNIPVGQTFVAQLGEALQGSDAFLLVDTPASRSSYWVSREVKTAIRYRGEGRYHKVLRAYASPCEGGIGPNWDASFPLDTHAHERTAEILAGRSTQGEASAPRGPVSGVSIEGNGLGQPSNWTGRQDELRHLDNWWFESTPGAWVQGLGGIGKSGLVQTWITALAYLGYEDPVTASVLHSPGREVVGVADAFDRLATWQTRVGNGCKLFFLDGYDEASSGTDMEALLQEAGRIGSRVIVTSRSEIPSSFLERFRTIDLSSMSRRDATAMLAEFGIAGSEAQAAASELGDHPLALMVFARYVASGKRTATEALEDVRTRSVADLGSTPQAGRSVRATVAASVRALTSEARRLLRALSAATEGGVVSLADFRTHAQWARPNEMQELARASLIQVDHLETPTSISIHPLVRTFIAKDGPP